MKQLSLDLRATFPEQASFSHTNLKYIKRWYTFYSQEDTIGQQPVDQFGFPPQFGQIPWGHHICILTNSKTVEEALFYMNKTIEGNWSRRMLEDNMEADLYGRQAKAVTNFGQHLPTAQSKLAEELLKDIAIGIEKLQPVRLKHQLSFHKVAPALSKRATVHFEGFRPRFEPRFFGEG